MVFIFIQSALPSDLSGAESGAIVQLLVRLLRIPESGWETLSLWIRKMAHFTEYFALGMSLCLTAKHSGTDRKCSRENAAGALTGAGMACAWGVGAFYAVTDEIHQYFVAGRSCEIRDMGIDAAGVLCGVLLIYGIGRVAGGRRE